MVWWNRNVYISRRVKLVNCVVKNVYDLMGFCITPYIRNPKDIWYDVITYASLCFCRTRESLASNTSSIVESNRRQNPALSPGHIGTASIGLPFSFRAIPEPPTTTQPEKLQKPSNCLASITSVWPTAQPEMEEMVEEETVTGGWRISVCDELHLFVLTSF